ncbi:hypothetical protein SPRG_01523 [Saprolegnia parasitica CBS 223.65]|uniref:DUF2306 domain-containing protein n=1 Tax=Saprolegnia parasitica (strain CBS 223.65) TaxID=695850 RepID=A0A067D5V0_SAPPC|nr:hypothetical protein SPRG_01523 [Saprolegnia parasitica CBS 223.65]KDO34387.1 hypothetical protein SPRG_01523 [Saprolegnia parasitica CBS 223.65]|eukprot:XP_012195123.1 hypothetical protein SPRG_01523 [Saprolegnia parasitica CBS 223.65]
MASTTTKAPVHVPLALHLAAVVPASIVGAVVLATKKGTKQHVLLGRIWTASMVATCLTSFGVTELVPSGSFSPVHALSVLTLASLGKGIQAIRQRNVKLHKQCMLGSMVGLVAAGVATLLPERRIHAWVMQGKEPWLQRVEVRR